MKIKNGKRILERTAASRFLAILLAAGMLLSACGDKADGGRDLRAEREQKEENKKEEAKPTEKEKPEEATPTEEPEPTEEEEPTEAPVLEETELMSFATQDVDGNEMTLGDLIRENDLTMINVWGTFCGPCIEEMPGLAECAEKYADRGFGIVGVTCDLTDWDGNLDPSAVADAKDIARDTGVKYPLIVETAEMSELFDTGYVPTTYFVDRAGNILTEAMIGSESKESWEQTIEGLLTQVGR